MYKTKGARASDDWQGQPTGWQALAKPRKKQGEVVCTLRKARDRVPECSFSRDRAPPGGPRRERQLRMDGEESLRLALARRDQNGPTRSLPEKGRGPRARGRRANFEKGVINSLNSQNSLRCLLEFWPVCTGAARGEHLSQSTSSGMRYCTRWKAYLLCANILKESWRGPLKVLIICPFLLSLGSRPRKSLHTCHLKCLWVEVKFYLRDAADILQGSDYQGAVGWNIKKK